jgi:hypothetical protein
MPAEYDTGNCRQSFAVGLLVKTAELAGFSTG